MMSARHGYMSLGLLASLALAGCGNPDGVVHFTLKFSKSVAMIVAKVEVKIKAVDGGVERGKRVFEGNAAGAWRVDKGDGYTTDFTYISNRDERIRAWIHVFRNATGGLKEMGKGIASDEVRVRPGEVVEVDIDLSGVQP
jgi:hypothetical protein